MSARSRELFALIPVGLLVTAGFTAVLITEADQLGDLSFVYGLYFLGLCLATHLVIRARLPDADPFLFPLVALLAAFAGFGGVRVVRRRRLGPIGGIVVAICSLAALEAALYVRLIEN